MSTLKKEKNLIIYTNDKGTVYTYDINSTTHQFVNQKTQKALLNMPSGLSSALKTNKSDNPTLNMLIGAYNNWYVASVTELFCRYDLQKLDKVMSYIGTIKGIESIEQMMSNSMANYWDFILENAKELKNYCVSNAYTRFDYRLVTSFENEIENKTLYKNCVFDDENLRLIDKANESSTGILDGIKWKVKNHKNDKFTKWLISSTERFNKFVGWYFNEFKWMTHRNINYFYDDCCIFFDELDILEVSLKELPKIHFAQYLIHYKKLYAEQIDTLRDKKLASIDYSKYFYEDENFITIFPKCNMDFVNEGKNMHNCVGGYGDRVASGNCIVIFIRDKINPDKSFITMDWYPQGRYWNYCVYAHNRNVGTTNSTPEAYKFISNYKTKLNNLGNN